MNNQPEKMKNSEDGIDLMDDNTVIINIHYQGKFLQKFYLSPKDNLGEIKHMQAESIDLILLPNFYYEYQGKRVILHKELEEILDLSEKEAEFNLHIVKDMYDENRCQTHVQKIQILIDDPHKFMATVKIESQFNYGKLDIFQNFKDFSAMDLMETTTGEKCNPAKNCSDKT